MMASTVETEIEAVTVYSRGALVRRVATLPADGELPPEIRVPDLPLTAEDSSFRVHLEASYEGGGEADPDAVPVAQSLRVALGVSTQASIEPETDEGELRKAKEEQALLQALIARAEREIANLSALEVVPRGSGADREPPIDSPNEGRLALLDFRHRRATALSRALGELRRRHRRAEERFRVLDDRRRRTSTERRVRPHALRKTAVVEVAGTGTARACDLRLVVEYLVPGARWAPAYTLRLDDNGDGALSMRALVAQRTGEDWDGIELTLATADPQRWQELPELPSLRIGRRQEPQRRRGWRQPPRGSEALFADWDRAFADARQPDARQHEAVQEEIFADGGADAIATSSFAGLEELSEDADTPPLSGGAAGIADLNLELPVSAQVASARATGVPPVRRPEGPTRKPAVRRRRHPRQGDIRAKDEMLAYEALRMPGPDAPERGTLVTCDRLASYLEILTEGGIEVAGDLGRALSKAVNRANSTGERLPPGHYPPSSEDGLHHAYVAETAARIPSDRSYRSIPLLSRTGEVQLRHVCVPRESTDVYRVVEAPNPLPAPVLRGPVDVYQGSHFVTTGELATTPRGGELALGIGVDPSVRVARNTRFREEPGGLARGHLILAHEINVEAENHGRRPIELELRERVPVTREDEADIEVKLGEVTPPWSPNEASQRTRSEAVRGCYRWRVTLSAGERIVLRAPYQIRISPKNQLIGGNRREP